MSHFGQTFFVLFFRPFAWNLKNTERNTSETPTRKYYTAKGESGVHTRKTGLDKDTNKALLLKHIQKQGEAGGKMIEFMQVLPMLSMRQIQSLVSELKTEGKIVMKGAKRHALWFVEDD